MGRGPKPAKSKEAKPPVARKSPKDEGAKVRDLEKRLAEALKREAEALARETATSEILRVIASSPTDIQPVFDTIIQSASRLCGVGDGWIALVEGDAGPPGHVAAGTPGRRRRMLGDRGCRWPRREPIGVVP